MAAIDNSRRSIDTKGASAWKGQPLQLSIFLDCWQPWLCEQVCRSNLRQRALLMGAYSQAHSSCFRNNSSNHFQHHKNPHSVFKCSKSFVGSACQYLRRGDWCDHEIWNQEALFVESSNLFIFWEELCICKTDVDSICATYPFCDYVYPEQKHYTWRKWYNIILTLNSHVPS